MAIAVLALGAADAAPDLAATDGFVCMPSGRWPQECDKQGLLARFAIGSGSSLCVPMWRGGMASGVI